MVRWLFSNFIIAGVIIMAVVFQPELRRALSLMGESRILRLFIKPEIKGASDAVVAAAEKLSSMHYGALIILERSVKLSSVIESGKRLNSEVSAEILQSIFTPYTPLHDGAVVIRGDVILAASCTLPMTDNSAYRRLYGMRHKAGVGVTEESDAIALIISEETGQISYAFEGKLFRDISPQELKQILAELSN
jgi:diadenylate cyclase